MSKKNELPGLVTGLVAILAAACFFLLGFLIPDSWPYAWLVFLAVPLTAIVMDIKDKNKDFSGAVIGFVAIFASAAFFALGFGFHKWHPGWLIFLAIPIAAIILDMLKKKELTNSVTGLAALLATVAFILLGTLLDAWRIAWLVFLVVPISAIIMNIVKVAAKERENNAGESEDVKQ